MVDMDKLSGLMRKNGIATVKELELKAGIGNGTLAKWGKGISPRLANVEKAAKALGCTVGELLTQD